MKKKFLVTVSNDFHHLTGVEFLCSFFKTQSEHQITLLHICRLDSKLAKNPLMEMWDNPDERVKGVPTVGAKKAMDKATALLSKSNMAIEEMIAKTPNERYGKVKDILKEGSDGFYDAIILGKRASYALQWFFERPADEIPKAIISDSTVTVPIWICPETEEDRKNVLVGVDGSDESLRAVDHVGYILSKQDQHDLTLLHVENGAGLDYEGNFNKSIEILKEHNVALERISTQRTWGVNVASTLLKFAEKGNYAAIAVGLKGVDKGFLKQINLTGGTTKSLIERTEKISLWCCP